MWKLFRQVRLKRQKLWRWQQQVTLESQCSLAIVSLVQGFADIIVSEANFFFKHIYYAILSIMNINLHILLASGTLKPFIKDIENSFNNTVSEVPKYLPIHDVDVIVYDNPEGTVPEQGIGGYTPNKNLVYISLDPSFVNLKESINSELKRTLAHEFHHTVRWINPGYGETLLDALITEGLADHFDLEIFPELLQPWSEAFNDNELKELMEKAKKEFNNTEYDHFAWFYGNEELGIPRWTGYSLGFKIVKDYLKKHPGQKPSKLYSAETNTFIE
jgi:uncharacterized protein YjaZ